MTHTWVYTCPHGRYKARYQTEVSDHHQARYKPRHLCVTSDEALRGPELYHGLGDGLGQLPLRLNPEPQVGEELHPVQVRGRLQQGPPEERRAGEGRDDRLGHLHRSSARTEAKQSNSPMKPRVVI